MFLSHYLLKLISLHYVWINNMFIKRFFIILCCSFPFICLFIAVILCHFYSYYYFINATFLICIKFLFYPQSYFTTILLFPSQPFSYDVTITRFYLYQYKLKILSSVKRIVKWSDLFENCFLRYVYLCLYLINEEWTTTISLVLYCLNCVHYITCE